MDIERLHNGKKCDRKAFFANPTFRKSANKARNSQLLKSDGPLQSIKNEMTLSV